MKFAKFLSSIIADLINLRDIPVLINDAPPFIKSVLSVIPKKSKFPMASKSKITVTLEVLSSEVTGITPEEYVNGQADVFIFDNSSEDPVRIEIDHWEMSLVDSSRIVLEVFGLTTWKRGYAINVGVKSSGDGSSSSSGSAPQEDPYDPYFGLYFDADLNYNFPTSDSQFISGETDPDCPIRINGQIPKMRKGPINISISNMTEVVELLSNKVFTIDFWFRGKPDTYDSTGQDLRTVNGRLVYQLGYSDILYSYSNSSNAIQTQLYTDYNIDYSRTAPNLADEEMKYNLSYMDYGDDEGETEDRYMSGADQVKFNNWHHFEYALDGSNLYVFIDGKLEYSHALSASFKLDVYKLIFSYNSELWLTAIRLNKSCIHTSNFDPPVIQSSI